MKTQNSIGFIHIPKTAGTSLRSCLEACYPSKNINAGYFIEEIEQLQQETQEILLARGHVPLSFVRDKFNLSVHFTVLREPISRVISHYHQLFHSPPTWMDEVKIGNSLYKLFLHPYAKHLLRNTMTKYLGFKSNEYTDSSFMYKESKNQHLEQAILAIEKKEISLAFSDCIDISLSKLNIPIISKSHIKIPEINRTKNILSHNNNDNHELYSSSINDMICTYNTLDIQLYSYARSIFHREHQDNLRKKGILIDDNKLISLLESLEESNQIKALLQSTITIHSDEQPIVYSFGFEEYIYDSTKHTQYRWIGSKIIGVIYFRTNPPMISITFDIVYAMSTFNFESFAITINNQPVQYKIEPLADGSSRVTTEHITNNQNEVSSLEIYAGVGIYDPIFRNNHSLAIANESFKFQTVN